MAMPKAAMHEGNRSVLGKYEIWSPVNVLDMYTEAETTSMKRPSDSHLGLRVSSLDGRHHARAGWLVDDIRGVPPGLSH